MSLRLASFGMRGFVGESLSIRTVMDFAAAFGTFVDGGRVLVARDTRTSSPMLHAAVTASLVGCGCEVLDLGICPTPMLQFSVGPLAAAGGVSISGGHNGMGWNSITLIGADGGTIEPTGGETVLDLFHAGSFRQARAGSMGSVREVSDFDQRYFDALAGVVDTAAIRAAGFVVLIDPLGGAGCPYLETFAGRMGFRLIGVNDRPSGYLPREAEPRPRSAVQLASFIRHVQGSAGFVLNSDMSRMSMVTEAGEPASEEYTLAVLADQVLRRRPGPLVTNCCTSRMIDDLAARAGVPVVKTRVGQAFVLSAVEDEDAVIGGEGSGSALLPAFSRGFDGFLMMALVLEAMAVRGASLSALIKELPRYHIIKRSFPCGSRRGYAAIEALKGRLEAFADAAGFDTTDGLRVEWPDGWVHARASHTESIVRVISEARDAERAEQRGDEMLRLLGAGVVRDGR